jgi:site-specific DNA-cytosine methylase
MNVLIACEFSGVVRDAFRRRGHYAVSCDLLPSETPGPHYWGDIFDVLNAPKDDSCWYGVEWDLMIAHPPCTYLSVSGLHWNGRIEGRKEKTEDAIDFVQRLLGAQIPRIALENPVGILNPCHYCRQQSLFHQELSLVENAGEIRQIQDKMSLARAMIDGSYEVEHMRE